MGGKRQQTASPKPVSDPMSIREKLKVKAAGLGREELFEAGGEQMLAIGLMSGEKNRLLSECSNSEGVMNAAKFGPRAIAMCIFDPETRKNLWNVNDLNDLTEIDAFPSEITDPMMAAVSRVNGWGKDAVNAGKSVSAMETTSSDTSSPPVLVAA